MSRKEIIAREQRWARPVALIAGLPLVLFFVSLFIRSELGATSGLATEALRTINEHSTAVVASGMLAGLGYAALAPPLVYLFRAANMRTEKMLTGLVGLCVAGPLLFGVQAAIGSLAQVDVASEFVVQETGVGDIYNLAEDLFSDSGLIAVAQATGAAGLLALIFAQVYTSLWAMRTGLLTRFNGTLGMALGAALILGPLAQTVLPVLFIWFAYFGLMIVGRAPRPRPPAWDAGEAVPWPRPGEEVSEPVAEDDVIEGDATEIPGLEENPNAARRERARKRKRKRRH